MLMAIVGTSWAMLLQGIPRSHHLGPWSPIGKVIETARRLVWSLNPKSLIPSDCLYSAWGWGFIPEGNPLHPKPFHPKP